ncbi:hypothetical protein KOW79_000136 [Hemibagrus wyckioides]|uniref:Uncharacterized protein n=1 Tax=Hemibagrus wyckioides TaxID=337641 RepID=A0A9D3P9Q1_9TELE|nr:hypothetical protein KOW79_000136 [Hemibagrus wyckioides]
MGAVAPPTLPPWIAGTAYCNLYHAHDSAGHSESSTELLDYRWSTLVSWAPVSPQCRAQGEFGGRGIRHGGVYLCSLMKLLVLAELRCCHKSNSAVYKLQGEVNPDCSIIWLSQDHLMVVDESGTIDPNTVVSYEDRELTLKRGDSDVLVREDCLSLGERIINCTALCELGKADPLANGSMSYPLFIGLISLGLLLFIILLSCVVVVVYKMYKRHHRSTDTDQANTANDQYLIQLQ